MLLRCGRSVAINCHLRCRSGVWSRVTNRERGQCRRYVVARRWRFCKSDRFYRGAMRGSRNRHFWKTEKDSRRKKVPWRKKIRRSEIDAKIKMPKMGFSKKWYFWKNGKTRKMHFSENEKNPICECEKKTCQKHIFGKGGVAITPDSTPITPKKGLLGPKSGVCWQKDESSSSSEPKKHRRNDNF